MNLFKKPMPSKQFLYVRDIVRQFLENGRVEKLISPESDEYFLLDKQEGVSVCICHGKVTISNHIYLYKQDFELPLTEQLIKEIRSAIEKERQELKKELFFNEIELLRKIIKL